MMNAVKRMVAELNKPVDAEPFIHLELKMGFWTVIILVGVIGLAVWGFSG